MEVTNRFKGLNRIDKVPKEQWTEVCDIVQGTLIKTIPNKNKWKNAKWLSEEALQTAMKRREVKGKGEKERSIVVNYSKLEGDRPVSLSGGSLWLG